MNNLEDFVINGGVLIKYKGTSKNVIVPNSVHTIGDRAFFANEISNLKISNSVKEIGYSAFFGNQLTEVMIPKNVEKIYQMVFDNNPNIKSINGQKTMYVNGSTMIIDSQRVLGKYVIYKTRFYGGDFRECYIAERDGVFAHGKTIKKAVEDIEFKFLKQKDISETIKSIKQKGVVTINDYRIITGACRFGIEQFMEENNITSDGLPIDDVLKLTEGYYGHERFKEAVA